MHTTTRGLAGEVLAARFLREKGYRILSSNYHSRFGEIDIIAVDGSYIVFVEAQIDKRSKLYKTVKSKGRIAEFAHQDEQTLKRWILGMLKKFGLTKLDLYIIIVENVMSKRSDF